MMGKNISHNSHEETARAAILVPDKTDKTGYKRQRQSVLIQGSSSGKV